MSGPASTLREDGAPFGADVIAIGRIEKGTFLARVEDRIDGIPVSGLGLVFEGFGPVSSIVLGQGLDGILVGGQLTISVQEQFKVGMLCILDVPTDPSDIFGYGTWELTSVGRTLIGVDAWDTDFESLGLTGGEKAHTLTDPETPDTP